MKSLSSGNLKRDYARFCIPCIVNLLVFSIYSIVDCLFVSRYVGSAALAAVTLAHPFLSVLFSIGITLAVGGSTLIAEALGEKNSDRANFIFSQNLIVTLILGLTITLAVFVFLDPFCSLLGADEETLPHTVDYLGTIAPFAVSFIFEYNLEFLVKTDGNPMLSLFTVIGCSLLNIFLDWLLVAVIPLGTFGAGLATGISQTVASVIFLSYILFSKNGLFHFCRFKWKLGIYKKLIPLGAADGSMEILSAILVLIYNRIMRENFGTDGVAAFGVIIYMNNLVFNMNTGVTQGMEPLVSFHKGAGELSSCKKLFRYALFVQCVTSAAVFAVCELFTGDIIRMFFTPEETNAISIAADGLRIFAVAFLLLGFNILCSGYMTAQCKPVPALIISLGRAFFVHIIILLAIITFLGTGYIWWTVVISEGIMAAVSLIALFRFNRSAR